MIGQPKVRWLLGMWKEQWNSVHVGKMSNETKSTILKVLVVGALSLGVVTSRVGSFVVTPLWLDFFNSFTFDAYNVTNITETSSQNPLVPVFPGKLISHSVGAHFIVFGQWGYSTLVSGVILLCILICCPTNITNVDRNFPKRSFFIIGFSQALSSLLMGYASSGTRVAPYLQAILGNFNIPVQFTVR